MSRLGAVLVVFVVTAVFDLTEAVEKNPVCGSFGTICDVPVTCCPGLHCKYYALEDVSLCWDEESQTEGAVTEEPVSNSCAVKGASCGAPVTCCPGLHCNYYALEDVSLCWYEESQTEGAGNPIDLAATQLSSAGRYYSETVLSGAWDPCV